MTGLTYDKFERKTGTPSKEKGDETINAKEILERHNNNVGSFYNLPMETESPKELSSLYDEMIEKLSELMSSSNTNGEGTRNKEDLSDLRGDTLSQVYYYSLTAIMLYLLYRLLYSKKK
jgi:hypothetical protein